MAWYAVRRLAAVIPISLGISALVFGMIHLVPGDIATALVGPSRTPEVLAQVRETLGLNLPIHIQYLRWLGKALHGDLGTSIYLNRPVLPEVAVKFGASLVLASGSFALAIPLGVVVGVISALNRGSIIDRIAMAPMMMGVSMPPFYLGMLLIIIFSVKLPWLPSSGMFSVTEEPTFAGVLKHLILPALALGAAPLTVVARMARASTMEVLRKEYIRTAYAKGLRLKSVVWRHVLRNALIPVTGLLGLQIGYLLSAGALVEVVFSWPGVGSTIVQSILTRDLPLTQGSVLIIALFYVAVNTAADVLQLALDPQIRFG